MLPTLLTVTFLLYACGLSAASPTPAPLPAPMDRGDFHRGSETSRMNSEDVRRLAAQRRRHRSAVLHGRGGEYATTHTPYFDFLPQHPEAIGTLGRQGDRTGSSSSSFPYADQSGWNSLFQPQQQQGHEMQASSSSHQGHQEGYDQQGVMEEDNAEPSDHAAEGRGGRRGRGRRMRDYAEPNALIWNVRNYRTQQKILEVVSKRRGIPRSDAEEVLEHNLTVELEEEIMQRRQRREFAPDYDRVDRALARLFPIIPGVTLLPQWNTLMTEAESENFVTSLVVSTTLKPDMIRNRLLVTQLDANVARQYLNADHRTLVAFALEHGILPTLPPSVALTFQQEDANGAGLNNDDNGDIPQHIPWMEGLTRSKTIRLINYVTTVTGLEFYKACHTYQLSRYGQQFYDDLRAAKGDEYDRYLHCLVYGTFQ
ncbi:hypothetical protein CBS101457_003030 [Exobasidium rhododendri]|nr:hypothetical protein CBS101457_003030 [Exobasidium rhododendri]